MSGQNTMPEEFTMWRKAVEVSRRAVLYGDATYDAATTVEDERWDEWYEVASNELRCLHCGEVQSPDWGLSFCITDADDSLLIQAFETADREQISKIFS